MRVGAAHDLAAVLENLYGSDVGPRAEVHRLLDPSVDHALDVGDLHARQGEVVAGREAEHPAEAGLAFGDDEPVLDPLRRRIGLERGEIVVEDEGVFVVGIARAARAKISGAEIAVRIVWKRRRRGDRLALALPGALHAVGRNQRPFAGERVQAAVRGLAPIEFRHLAQSWSSGSSPAPSDGEQTNTSASRPEASR